MADWVKQPGWLVMAVGVMLFGLHLYLEEPDMQSLLPVTIYEFSANISFESQDGDVYARTYLPQADERQVVLEQELKSGHLMVSQMADTSGLKVRWSAALPGQRIEVSHRSVLALKGVRYQIDEMMPLEPIGDLKLAAYLESTPAVQVNHPEVVALWQSIMPGENKTLLEVLKAIYSFTSDEIEGAEFKGYTDALTALRLRQASCNGKGRLFAALARGVGLPTRLVGGIILNEGQKKTSHQWVEVFIAGKWVPFDPTNHYFAEIPSNYLTLYRGDEALFSHTRNINFDYLFDIQVNRLVGPQTNALIEQTQPAGWLARIFHDLELDAELAGTFLLFPLAALVVAVCRNVLGMNSFGIFLPMLIGAACRFTGLLTGLVGFVLIVLLAGGIRRSMEGARLLQVPRISALITAITVIIILLIWLDLGRTGATVTALVFFPVIVLSFAAERMNTVLQESSRLEAAKLIVSTLIIITLCYVTFGSKLLHGVFLTYPELLLLVLATQLLIGSWPGFRVSEYLRFRNLISQHLIGDIKPGDDAARGNSVLGINARNINLVTKLNAIDDMATADNKILTKSLLAAAGVPVPRTLAVVHDFWDLQSIPRQLPHWYSFVLKPAMGSQGKGILVVHGRDGDDYLLAGGGRVSQVNLLKHIRDIIAGVYSNQGERDFALIESVLLPTPFYQQFYAPGLSDIRVILVQGQVMAAMLRVPTSHSNGKANLHQGAVGVPIDILSGKTGDGYLQGKKLAQHPDTGASFKGEQIPNWQRILEVARAAQQEIPLGYTGIDIADDVTQGPVVVEINARPGLEIQNVHGYGFADLVNTLAAYNLPDNPSPEGTG